MAESTKIALKYGCNPNQRPAAIYMENQKPLPVKILSGSPGYINFLDALNAWQLVRELKAAFNIPAAASFKHVSPAGAALGLELDDNLKRACHIDPNIKLSSLACAYARARGADRMSSFGDFIALSEVCDVETANLIKSEVSDGIIAPGYQEKALMILKAKKKGAYNIIQIDENYSPAAAAEPMTERKQVFGITFEQGRNEIKLNKNLLLNIVTENKIIPEEALRDLLISLIVLKYTQSNSVCYAKGGQAIGIGAGQQSRIHCTRLAGDKADFWHLRQMSKVVKLPFIEGLKKCDMDNAIDTYIGNSARLLKDGNWQRFFKHRPEMLSEDERKEYLAKVNNVSLGSDAFFPFGDNIERAYESGVRYIAQPGGSMRDSQVIAVCDKYKIAMAFTGVRLFHH